MAVEQDIARFQETLAEELGEDMHNLDRIRLALEQLVGEPSLGPHATLLLALTGILFEEEEAAALWEGARQRRRETQTRLGRPYPLRAALVDDLAARNLRSLAPSPLDLRLLASPRQHGTDPLTGLLDTEALVAHLNREVQRSKRFRTGFSFLLVEVDDFHGLLRQAGEGNAYLVQREVGLLASNAVRDIDLAARLAPARFGIVLPETDRTGGFLVADRLRQRVAQHFSGRPLAGRRVPVTISGGLACFPEDATFGAEVMQRAEQALHQARSRGADRISVHFRDRREYIRLSVDPERLRIDVVERGEPAAGASTGQIARNISPQGVLFESSRAFRVGQAVNVICNDLRRIDQVILPGRVVRLEEMEPAGDARRYEVGLAFEVNWEHQVMEILEFLERYRQATE